MLWSAIASVGDIARTATNSQRRIVTSEKSYPGQYRQLIDEAPDKASSGGQAPL
jgi:hypothetical protein